VAQYFHGHAHYHRGHYHLHGHFHYPSYYPYSASPGISGSYGYTPTYTYPSVVTSVPAVVYQTPVINSIAVVPASATSLRPNPLPPYAGPGVTLRLPAEYPNSIYVRIDKRDVELKPGTQITFKDKPTYFIEFDRGGDFGAAQDELMEGSYRMMVGPKGWFMVPDTDGNLRRNVLPGEPKK